MPSARLFASWVCFVTIMLRIALLAREARAPRDASPASWLLLEGFLLHVIHLDHGCGPSLEGFPLHAVSLDHGSGPLRNLDSSFMFLSWTMGVVFSRKDFSSMDSVWTMGVALCCCHYATSRSFSSWCMYASRREASILAFVWRDFSSMFSIGTMGVVLSWEGELSSTKCMMHDQLRFKALAFQEPRPCCAPAPF